MLFDLNECQSFQYNDINYLGEITSKLSLKIISYYWQVMVKCLKYEHTILK